MIKVEYVEVWGFEHAIRGMRNPMNSWGKCDSHYCDYKLTEDCDTCGALAADDTGQCLSETEFYCIGPNDLGLMQRLFKAGTEHRKYFRQIFVSMDITAPLYWWKEEETYTDGKIEVIDFIESCGFGFCLGNACKYIARAGKKDPKKEVQDLKKAIWYINRRIQELEEDKQ